MKYLFYILLFITLQSCITTGKIVVNYQTVLVKDTLTLGYSHYHYESADGTPFCIELPADTIISENKFYLKKN
jgi:hypothetical protein